MSAGSSYDLELFSPAKINLFLRIIRRREDGYHELASLFQTVGFGDTLKFKVRRRRSKRPVRQGAASGGLMCLLSCGVVVWSRSWRRVLRRTSSQAPSRACRYGRRGEGAGYGGDGCERRAAWRRDETVVHGPICWLPEVRWWWFVAALLMPPHHRPACCCCVDGQEQPGATSLGPVPQQDRRQGPLRGKGGG